MMEIVGSHETSVYFYQTVECHVPKNSNLHVSWENEISHGKYGCGYMKGESRRLPQKLNFVLSQQLTYHMPYIISLLEEALKFRWPSPKTTVWSPGKDYKLGSCKFTHLAPDVHSFTHQSKAVYKFMQQPFCFLINITIPVKTVFTLGAYVTWF